MIAEAMEYIKGLSDKSKKAEFKRRPGDPPHVIHIEGPDGKLEQTSVEPGYRSLEVSRIADLVAIAKNHFDQKVKDAGRMVVSYTQEAIALTFDHKTGYETARLNLRTTKELAFFAARRKTPNISPADLYQAMRFDLYNTYNDPKLLSQVSKVSFADRESANTATARGRESMGASVEKQVAEPESLPDETQVFNVRVFKNPELAGRFPLSCFLDPDPGTRQWILYPHGQSWDDLETQSLDLIGGLLRDMLGDTAGVTIYEGTYCQSTAGFTNAG